jgi:hypothetical protein
MPLFAILSSSTRPTKPAATTARSPKPAPNAAPSLTAALLQLRDAVETLMDEREKCPSARE